MWVGKPPKPLYLTSTSFLSVGKNSCRLCLVHMTDWSRFHVWNLFKSELIFFWHETPCGARHGQHLHFSVLNFLTIQNSFSHQASQFVSQNVLSSSSLSQHLKEVDKIQILHIQALLAGAPDLSLSSSVPPTPDSETLAAFAREIKVQKMLLVLLSLVFILLPLQER